MILSKIFGMIKNPTATLQKVYKEAFMDTLIFLFVLVIIQLATSSILNFERLSVFYVIFSNWIQGVLMLVVMSVLFHVFTMRLRKGTNLEDYVLTLRATIYSTVPFVLFGWIPFIALPASIWLIYLLMKSMSLYFNMSKKKALLIVLLPYIIVLLLAFI